MFEYRDLNTSDLDQLLALHLLAHGRLDETGYLYKRDREFFERHIHNEGLIVGVFCLERIIGYAAAHLPEQGRSLLGQKVGLSGSELDWVAEGAGMSVHPDFRGLGLGDALLKFRNNGVLERGYAAIIGVIFSRNLAGLVNQFHTHALVRGFIEDTDGTNFLLYKHLHREPRRMVGSCTKLIPLDAIDRQIEAVKKGYSGFSLATSTEKPHIQYGQFQWPAGHPEA